MTAIKAKINAAPDFVAANHALIYNNYLGQSRENVHEIVHVNDLEGAVSIHFHN